GFPVVAPRGARRQRHQDRFGTPAGLQAEQRAAVVHQVEFDVAAAPVGLEVLFCFAVWHLSTAFEDRPISVQKVISYGAGERKGKIEVAIGEVIEEDAADAARLAAVAQLKIFVAPALETRVAVGAEGRQRVAAGGMEMAGIVFEAIAGREVHAAAEPPGRRRGEEAHVHVHRRAIRIARVQHERHAHRVVRLAGELRPRRRRRGRQAAALHAREVDAAALEDATFLDDARHATAPFGALPAIGTEGRAFERFERGDDSGLQFREVIVDCLRLHGYGVFFKARWPMSLRYCMPSKRMRSTASYARLRAIFTESPSAVTHSTRPPLVSTVLPSSCVPAWNTRQSSAGRGRPSMRSPLRGSSG